MAEDRPLPPFVFDGYVLAPDGTPAEGATVTSSAGGKAITDPSGRYRLVAEVPRAARFVQITAVGSTDANHSASTLFELGAASGVARVDPLQLVPSVCQPRWMPTFGGVPGVDGTVSALVEFNDGSGSALYAGGAFALGGGIARWDGARWSALGGGLGGGRVYALTVYDDGSGSALYAGGEFTSAGGVTANRIARWDGTSWSTLGSGTDDRVTCLRVYDDGGGPALYAGGWFESAGGIVVNRIARWDGSSWTPLDGGIQGLDGVFATAVYDDGSGPALYVAIADGFISASIERWDGSSWSTLAVADGFDGGVIRSLTVHDDGEVLLANPTPTGKIRIIHRPALYAGGSFDALNGVSANNIARWDGSSWSALGSGLDEGATALGVFDDGTGMALYAGGVFTTAGGSAVNHIAKWDGSSWTSLGSGLSGSPAFDLVRSLIGVETGSLRGLYAGGVFTALDSGDSFLAKWGCVPVPSSSKVRPR